MQSICELPQPRKLEWKVSANVRQEIQAAITSIDKYELAFFRTKDICKL